MHVGNEGAQLLLPQRRERKLPVRFTATALLFSVLIKRSQARWPIK